MLVALLRVPDIVNLLVSAAPPVTTGNVVGIFQLYLVPTGIIPFVILTGETTNGTPLQVTVLIAVISGVGFNVTITVKAAPEQFPEVGVTR
jgi:hypothetical protein